MNKIMKNTLILTAITLVAGLLLGLVYDITKAPIAKQEALAKAEAYATVFPEAETFNTVEDTADAAAYLAENGFAVQNVMQSPVDNAYEKMNTFEI